MRTHKFCSFCSSCVVPTFVYGRLHREKKDWEKKVFVCFKLTLHHRRPTTTERRSMKINFNNIYLGGFLIRIIYWSMPQWNFWFFLSFVVFGAAVYRPSFMVDYTAERRKTERKNEKWLFVCFPITSPPALQHREKKFFFLEKNF